MLSKKCKYALKALLNLARQPESVPMIVSELAVAELIPRTFLEVILLDLKHHGIVQSKKGKGGGYYLAKPSSSITIGQVVRIIDGPLAPIPCVSQVAYSKCDECQDENTCAIRTIMKQVRDATATILDSTTLADVGEQSTAILNLCTGHVPEFVS